MIALIAMLVLALAQTPDPPPAPIGPFTGYAAHYNVQRMEKTSRIRRLPLVPCMVATDLAPLGSWVDVRSELTGEVKRCRVTDLSGPNDRARHLRNRLYIEFDWPSARAMCQLTRVGQKRWRDCPVTVWLIDYPKDFTPPVRADGDELAPVVEANQPDPNQRDGSSRASGSPWRSRPAGRRNNDPACRIRAEATFEPQCRAHQDVDTGVIARIGGAR